MPDSAREVTPQSRLKMTGGRYERGFGYPLDALPELVQYERLVTDVAKSIWRAANPGRLRVPRGFSQAVGLRLTAVQRGSAIPILEHSTEQETLPDVDVNGRSILDAAQDLVDGAFAEIVLHNRLPSEFPSGLTSHFLKLGRTLQGNEAIEFGQQTSPKKARYTQAARLRFLSATQKEDIPLEAIAVGFLTALDTNQLTMTLTDLEGHNIDGAYSDDTLTPDLLEVFNRRAEAPVVRLECSLLLGADQQVKRIDDVYGLEVFLSAGDTPGKDRLLELVGLKEGWLDGYGEAPDLIALEHVRDLLYAVARAGLPDPGVFPREDGSLQVQWITRSDVWTAVVSAEGAVGADLLAVRANEERSTSSSNTEEIVDFFVARTSEGSFLD